MTAVSDFVFGSLREAFWGAKVKVLFWDKEKVSKAIFQRAASKIDRGLNRAIRSDEGGRFSDRKGDVFLTAGVPIMWYFGASPKTTFSRSFNDTTIDQSRKSVNPWFSASAQNNFNAVMDPLLVKAKNAGLDMELTIFDEEDSPYSGPLPASVRYEITKTPS